MSNESLITIIILLVGSHYGSMIYRLHKTEQELDDIRKEFAASAIAAANAAVIAAQAVAAAAQAIVRNGNWK